MTITDTDKVTVELTKTATETVTRCTEHSRAVVAAWNYCGTDKQKEKAAETAVSWMNAMSTLLTGGWGPADVMWDSPLSLTVSTRHIFFGLIFHGQYADQPLEGDQDVYQPGAVRLGRYCSHLRDVDKPHGPKCLEAVYQGKCATHGDVPEGHAFAMPTPGTWSFHS